MTAHSTPYSGGSSSNSNSISNSSSSSSNNSTSVVTIPTLPLGAGTSPGSLRTAVQGFFRTAVAAEKNNTTSSFTYQQQLPSYGVEPIHNDKLLEKHTGGIRKTKRLSTAELQMVIADTPSFHTIQAILRDQHSQTNALASHMGYDLVLERYHEMRRLQHANNISTTAAVHKTSANSTIASRRSLYDKLSLVTPQASKLVAPSETNSNNTTRQGSRRHSISSSRSPPRRKSSSSSSSHSQSPPGRTRSSDLWSPLEESNPEKEEPIHAILVSPTCVQQFVKMDHSNKDGVKNGTGTLFSSTLPLENDDSSSESSVLTV